MIKKLLSVIPAVAFVLSVSAFAGAQEFSADMVSREGNEVTNAKIYVGHERVRMEMSDSIMIMLLDKKITWIIMPSDEMYMEQSFDPSLMPKVSTEFDGETGRVPMGTEVVDGQTADKFKITYVDNGKTVSAYQWLRGQIPVKTEAEDQSWSTEYKNIEIATQPADLFEPPADYKKFDMPSMGDMFKDMGNMIP